MSGGLRTPWLRNNTTAALPRVLVPGRLFRSPLLSHNVHFCFLDDRHIYYSSGSGGAGGSSRRGCHGYGNRSDAPPRLSLVTETGGAREPNMQAVGFSGEDYTCCTRTAHAQEYRICLGNAVFPFYTVYLLTPPASSVIGSLVRLSLLLSLPSLLLAVFQRCRQQTRLIPAFT